MKVFDSMLIFKNKILYLEFETLKDYEGLYYLSFKTKHNKIVKEKSGLDIKNYQLVDIKTKLMVVCANSKKELFNKFEEVKERYYNLIKSKEYNKILKRIEDELKEVFNDAKPTTH